MAIKTRHRFLTDSEVERFWEEGYVLIKGVLTPEETWRARQAILDLIPRDLTLPPHYHAHAGRIKPHNPDGNHSYYTPELLPLLINENLYKAAADLYDYEYLRSGDGSVGITIKDGAGEIRSQRLHLDWRRPETADAEFLRNKVGIGGCYYLTRVEENGGGIHVVPNGPKLVMEKILGAPGNEGLALNKNWGDITDFPPSVEVMGDAGDFVMMHHLMPHAASRNRRATARVVQFTRFWRVEGEQLAEARTPEERFTPQQHAVITPLGRKLLGLEPWVPAAEG